MNGFARVTSIPALVDFRASLCTFSEQVQGIIAGIQMAIRRQQEWLEEQVFEWQRQVRYWEDAVAQARTELERRKMVRIGDRAPDCTEQEMILRRARQRLEEAQDKLAASRRWLPALRREIDEYQGPARQLSGFLESEHVRALALLQQRIDALDAYVHLAGPTPPSEVPVGPLPPEKNSGPKEPPDQAEPKGEMGPE